jgi:GH24 family phage-related lysozyme (muramidase)
MFSGADMQGADLTMRDNAREAQDVVQPMVTPVSRGRQPEMGDSPALVDAPSIDTRSNEMLDKPKGIMNRPVAEGESRPLTIPSNIDMSFLGEKEGFKLDAYVPKDKEGKAIDQSGVTVGTGVDLGSKNEDYFKGLEPSILSKLKPHFGKKREAAQKSLEENALSLTEDEALALDNFVKVKEFNTLKKRWNRDSEISWDDLTTNQATAVASVYYQHGNQTFKYNFWDQTTSGNWDAAHDNLMTWGGSTPTRRRDEAALLKSTN